MSAAAPPAGVLEYRPDGDNGLWRRWPFDYNPFYLLSAACMLWGCLALTNSHSWSPIALYRVVILIATLNAYELLVVGLALYLVRARQLARDGRILMLLEAVFLFDLTFLNLEVANLNLSIGMIVNAIVFLLALVKIAAVSRAVGETIRPQLPAIIVQLALLAGLPCLFKWCDSAGQVNDGHFYAAWWIVGLIPLAYDIFQRIRARQDSPQMSSPSPFASVSRTYLVLPYLSLIAHVGLMHWVFNIHVYACDLAPILLGAVIALRHVQPGKFADRSGLIGLQIFLAAVALAMASDYPNDLKLAFGLGRSLTPILLTGAVAYATVVYVFLLPLALYCFTIAALVLLGALFGPSIDDMENTLTNLIERFTPSTQRAWGELGVVSAFILLGIGALISLGKRQRPDPPPANP